MQNLAEVKIIKELFREHQFRFYKGLLANKRVFVWAVRSPNFSWRSAEKRFHKLLDKSMPNILTLRHFASYRGEYRFVIDGISEFKTLKSWINLKPGHSEKLKICSSILRSLLGLHSQGFTHCWITEDSFIVNSEGNACMIDFPIKNMYYSSVLKKDQIKNDSLFGLPPEDKTRQKIFDTKNIALLVVRILTGSVPPMVAGKFLIPRNLNRDFSGALNKILNEDSEDILQKIPILIGRIEMMNEEEDSLKKGSLFNYFSIFSRKYLEPFSRVLLTIASIWASFEILYLLGFTQIDSRVPNVIGQTESIGFSKLQSKGFDVNVVGFEDETNFDKGLIARTSPKAGSSLKKGQLIDVWISSGYFENIIPDFIDLDFDSYISELIKNNIWPSGIESIRTDQFLDWEISSLNPPPGSILKQGEDIILNVYFLEDTDLFEFPDFQNLNISNSLQLLENQEFKINRAVRTKRYFDGNVNQQKIIYQFPKYKSMLPAFLDSDLLFIVKESDNWSFDMGELPPWVNDGGIEIVVKYGSEMEVWKEVITRGLKKVSFQAKMNSILSGNQKPVSITISQDGKLAWSSQFE